MNENRVPTVYTIAEVQARRIDAGMAGVRVAREIALDQSVQAAARVGAARLLMEFAGFLERGRPSLAREPASMSTTELQAEIAKIDDLMAEAARRATDITPNRQATSEEDTDFADLFLPK